MLTGDCSHSIRSWMADIFPQLNNENDENTEVLVCVPDRFLPKILKSLGPYLVSLGKPLVRNHGDLLIQG